MQRENWNLIPGWDWYEASDLGRIRSVDHRSYFVDGRSKWIVGRVLKQSAKPSGHLFVNIGRNEFSSGIVDVHILVMRAFGPPKPSDKHEVRHLDGNEKNNKLSNLCWGTRKRNSQDKKWHRGQSNYILTPEQVREIKTRLRQPYHGIQNALAREFGVSHYTICDIKRGKSHQDIVV